MKEGFGPARIGTTLKYAPYDDDYYASGGKWGFVDARGNWAMQATLDYTRGFQDGLAPAMQSAAYGFLDLDFIGDGTAISKAYQFSEGVAAVWLEDKRWTYLDKQGKRLMEPRFDLAYSFSEGLVWAIFRQCSG